MKRRQFLKTVAISAAKQGAKVFLIGYQPYLGEDLCGNYRHMFDQSDTGGDPWLSGLLPANVPPTPMRIKTALDKELIDHGVDFLYCSYVADVVFDGNDRPAGVVINNRTGRQAILAKTIIDCSQGAWVSRLAGASFVNTIENETMPFQFVAAGNKGEAGEGVSVNQMPVRLKTAKRDYTVLAYDFNHKVEKFDFQTLAEAEQHIRDKAFDIEQVDSADQLYWVQPYRLRSRSRGNAGQGVASQENTSGINTDAFMPRGMDTLYTFSTCADVSHEQAAKLTEPAMQLLLGRQLGQAAAAVADFMVSPIDMMAGRRYPDTISYHKSNFDTHGYTIHPYFIIKQPDGGHVTYDVDLPLRCLLPRGLAGIFVTGLGAGAHRDAMPVIRMQPCLQNQGYAVGCLAAQLVSAGIADARQADLKDLQRHLVDIGSLPERALTDTDNFPLSDDMFAEARTKIGNDFEGLEILLSDMERGKTYLERLLQQDAPDADKLHAAITLGVLGIDAGWNLIAAAIDAYDAWDEGWNFTGMGQFGFSLSRLDTMVIALGRCQRAEALPGILAKAEMLAPDHHFSHYRAVSVALETMGSRQAALVLFKLLNTPGVSGHHVITKTDAVRATVPSPEDVSLRNQALRELHLARALYRCGDHFGLGRQILEKYANDLHGHYYRHAAGVLGKG